MNCNGEQIIHPGCNFCIIKLPCKCSVISNSLSYPPSFSSCKKTDNITTIHPVNLALLQQFFKADQLKHIKGSSYFVNELNVKLPNFNIYNHSYNSFLVKDQHEHLNLQKMAKVAKKEGVIFQNLAEPLLNGVINVNSSWPDVNGILGLIGAILSSVLFF